MRAIKFAILLCSLSFLSNAISAQKKADQQSGDSLHIILLQNQSKQLQQLDSARQEDSIKKTVLEKQLSEVKADDAKKQSLLKELEQIRNKNEQRILIKKQKIDSLRSFVKGYAVAPFLDDTIFSIYNKIGSLSAKERAVAITNRIKGLADNYFFKADSLTVVGSETTADIVFGENIIMSVSENDALWQNSTKENLAEQYSKIISKAVLQYKSETSWQTIIKRIGMAAAVVLVLSIIIFFIGKLFRAFRSKIIAQKNKRIKGIKLRSYELLNADRQLYFLLTITTILKWIVVITCIYLALPILFGIFPWTKGFAETLFAYFLTPLKKIMHSVWDYLPNLVTIVVVIFVFRYVIRGFYYLKTEIEKERLTIPGFYPDWANPTFQIVRVLIYAFMLIIIFPYLPGSDSPVFKGVSVFLGVLFTFGSSGPLGNVIAGLALTYMRAFKIGDRIKVGDITGDIIEKSLLVTRIRTIKNEIISVPNSNVINSHTINYSSDAMDKGLIMHTTVTIGYDVPWKNMHQALIDAALRTEFLLHEPSPFVLQTSLDDFYVSYQINAYTREPNKQAIIYSQLHQNIQDCCNEAGIEIMSPHYQAARDGNTTTIPEGYLPKDYKAPGFRIQNLD